jgi:hypothetical protein
MGEARKSSETSADGPQGEVESPDARRAYAAPEVTAAALREPRKPYEAPKLAALELLAVVQGTGISVPDDLSTKHN